MCEARVNQETSANLFSAYDLYDNSNIELNTQHSGPPADFLNSREMLNFFSLKKHKIKEKNTNRAL